MAETKTSGNGDAESNRGTRMMVDGEAAAPPAAAEGPMLKNLWIAVLILLGLSIYTAMLRICLNCVISDPCQRQEIGRMIWLVNHVLNIIVELLALFYLTLL